MEDTPDERESTGGEKVGGSGLSLGVLIPLIALLVSGVQVGLSWFDNRNALRIEGERQIAADALAREREEQERELQIDQAYAEALANEREQIRSWDRRASEFFQDNRDLLTATDEASHAKMRRAILAAFPPSVSEGLFDRLVAVSGGPDAAGSHLAGGCRDCT